MGREVPGAAEKACFVLDLHHEHGAVAFVDPADMAHNRCKSAGVGFHCLGAEGRDGPCDPAGFVLRTRESRHILLDPRRNVGGPCVFPRCKPEEYEAKIMPAGLLDKAVYERKIELSLLWLDKLPRNGRQNGV